MRDRRHARELEASALLGLQSGSDDSLALALDAARLEPDARAEAVLREALIESRLRRSLPALGLFACSSTTRRAAELLVAGGGRRLLVYDAATNRLLRSFEDPATVRPASSGLPARWSPGTPTATSGCATGERERSCKRFMAAGP